MRLPIICSKCLADDPTSVGPFQMLEWNDEGRYEVTCAKGHTAITILQEQKFELLFDIGAYAIVDGYFREAVSSFTSSLERFYEFFIVSVLLESEIDVDTLSAAWKLVSAQSERQLGAFVSIYTRELKKAPTVLSSKSVAFRNSVIHRGKIPSRQEAIDYGNDIFDLIRSQLKELRQGFPNGVQKAIFEHLRRSRKESDERPSTMTIPTIISLSRHENARGYSSLNDALKELPCWSKEKRET